MVSCLFYLINLACERKRELRSIKTYRALSPFRVRMNTIGLIGSVFLLAYCCLLVVAFPTPRQILEHGVGIYIFVFYWICTVLSATCQRIRNSSNSVRAASVLTAFVFYWQVFYLLETYGIKGFPGVVGRLFDDTRAPFAVIILGVFFLYVTRRSLRPFRVTEREGRLPDAA